jgi:hypothetical protein
VSAIVKIRNKPQFLRNACQLLPSFPTRLPPVSGQRIYRCHEQTSSNETKNEKPTGQEKTNMNTNEMNMKELNLDEMEQANGGFWDEIWEFGKGVWKKTKDVVYKLKDWG